MIELKFTGMCEGCTCADLELDELEYASIEMDRRIWNVRCKHLVACDKMEDKTIERLKNYEHCDPGHGDA